MQSILFRNINLTLTDLLNEELINPSKEIHSDEETNQDSQTKEQK